MAVQKGLFLIGTYDGLIYYRESEGLYCVRRVPAQVRQSAATKAAAAELGTKSRSASLIKNTFGSLIGGNKDKRMWGRLLTAVGKVMEADTSDAKGERCVQHGNLDFLLNFQFNAEADTRKVLKVQPETDLSRAGEAGFLLPELVPYRDIRVPKGTDTVVISCQAAVLDFTAFSSEVSTAGEIVIPYTDTLYPARYLHFDYELKTGNVVMLVFALDFFRKNGSFLMPIVDKRFQAAAIAGVEKCY